MVACLALHGANWVTNSCLESMLTDVPHPHLARVTMTELVLPSHCDGRGFCLGGQHLLVSWPAAWLVGKETYLKDVLDHPFYSQELFSLGSISRLA